MPPNGNRDGLIWGVPLVAIGFLFLLSNFGLIGSIRELFLAVLFGAGGLMFLMVFQRDRQTQWWALIPSFALFGLAIRDLVGWGLPFFGRSMGESLFLGSIGVAFLLIYLLRREHWWPIIPAGALLTLATEAFLEIFIPSRFLEGFFMAGLGLTFFAIYYLYRSDAGLRWTLPVSLGLLVLSAIKVVKAVIVWKFVWPLALIALGLLLISRQIPRDK